MKILNIYGGLIFESQKETIKEAIQEWDLWFASDEKFSTERGTEDFKRIQAMYLAYKAYHEFLNAKA